MMSVPDWVHRAVFYQVFPDRFANGDPSNDPPNVEPWGAVPNLHGFQGGDLQGITQKLDYLVDLGVNALYLNPIFMASSNHRYNTYDYYRIDPKLGSLQDFERLIESAHEQGVRVVLDGVFNHSGRGFFAFDDLAENQEHSTYRDWYHVRRFPINPFSPGEADAYLGWWKLKSLPKLNTANPRVREYLMQVVRYWTEKGIDGWRLDVPNEIDDDDFWLEFRETVRSINPEAYLVGEIWKVDPRWVGPTHFDGLMNYPFRAALLAFLADGDSIADLTQAMQRLLEAYSRENVFAQYLPLGSHDTPRLRTLLGGDLRKVRLMSFIQFIFPGIPAIYYGDEIGMEGGKDPDNRWAFPWDESSWDHDLRGYVQRLADLRKRSPALQRGWLEIMQADPERNTLLLKRGDGEDALIAAINGSDAAHRLSFNLASVGLGSAGRVGDRLSGRSFPSHDGQVTLDLSPWEGVLLGMLDTQPHTS